MLFRRLESGRGSKEETLRELADNLAAHMLMTQLSIRSPSKPTTK